MSAYRRCPIMTRSGFSLLELVIVITIVAILSTMATLGFRDFQEKGWVEAQVRGMASDINDLRINAITTKQRQCVVLYGSSYVMKSYSSETFTTNAEFVASGTTLATKKVKYSLKSTSGSGTFFTGNAIEINQRGMLAGLPQTVFLDTGTSTTKAAFDCLTIHTVRVNIGKQSSAGACNDI